MAIEIATSRGLVAIVNDDCGFLREFKWAASPSKSIYGGHYAITQIKRKTVYMHRLILGVDTGVEVDHINNNGLDNRRENLQVVSRSQNMAKSRPQGGKRFKGVEKMRNRYRAYTATGKKREFHGCFDTPEDAARAYDNAARKKYGNHAYQNFPEGSAT